LRYGKDEVVCVIDSPLAGRRVMEVKPDLRRDTPIVATVREALDLSPTSLLVGLAPAGGRLPEGWMDTIEEAAEAGVEIVSGLHQRLAPELPGKRVWDVRQPPSDLPLFSGEGFGVGSKVVHTVGTNSAVGKMTATLELEKAAREAGLSTQFAATGQSGVVISGWGICVDAVVSDFVAGAAERLVVEAARESPDLILVEGQGSLAHPAFSGVTAGLLHGSCADCLVLCADASDGETVPGVPKPDPGHISRLYKEVAALVKPAPVVAVSVNTSGLEEDTAEGAVAEISHRTGLPAADPFRHPVSPLLGAVMNAP
jgi:uncharacterized NAD-dependent epimerase/dehydratase family protein